MNILEFEVQQEARTRRKLNAHLGKVATKRKLTVAHSNGAVIDHLLRKVKNRGELQAEYKSVCSKLDQQRLSERTVTPAEKLFLAQFRAIYRVQLMPQVWIGNFLLDYFTPAFGVYKTGGRGFRLKGVAFEIDGPIHERQGKSQKDLYKEASLHDLGISVIRLTNEQVYSGSHFLTRSAFDAEYGRLCSRARQRLWSRIHLLTVIYHQEFGMVRF